MHAVLVAKGLTYTEQELDEKFDIPGLQNLIEALKLSKEEYYKIFEYERVLGEIY